jgi:DNA uptake protein ComE-like DNA-binding protein
MKKVLFILLINIFILLSVYAKPDLNKSSLEELKTLPIEEEQAEDIYSYRYYISFFKSVYDLRNIPSIDQKTLNKLKPLVTVSHFDDKDETATRRDEIYYLLQRLGSNEGSQEGISDIWEDYLMTPRNINAIGYSDILSMPNVSPIDAASILNRRAQGDSISSYRDLRKTFGISHYGATNLKNYVYYTEAKAKDKLFIDYQVKYNDTYYEENTEEMYKEGMIQIQAPGDYNVDAPKIKMQSPWGYFKMDEYSASVTNKLRLRFNNNWKAGLLHNTQKGEDDIFENELGDTFKNSKYFAGYEDFISGSNYLKVYAGNYRATFGEGLVMENTDFYSSRKTGHGFSKRITGIVGDLSRTQEYALFGGAVEWKHPLFNAAVFYSNDDKDALVTDTNENGIFDEEDNLFSYVTLSRRFENDKMEGFEEFCNTYDEQGYDNIFPFRVAPRLDAFNEQVLGTHLEFSPFIGSHIGFTGYEARYDRDFEIPEADELKYLLINTAEQPDDEGYDEQYDDALAKYRIADSEIAALYSTKTDDYDRNYRTIMGMDFRTVLNNTAISGEYAELLKNGYEDLNFGKNPKALLLSTYSQFEDAYFIALYRDYDLGFDNPYGRGFSEHEKFNGTVLDKYAYVLTNPLMADMSLNSAQAQAERGVYFETRYKILRNLTLNRTYLDIWERKSDSRFSVRFQGELDFRPIYQLSLRLKYKHQTNRYDDDADRSVSITNETTGKVSMYLSAFDRISFEYRLNKVWFPPYVYLTNDAEIPEENDTIAQATSLLHGDYLAVDYTHNFNTNLKVQGAFIFWNGHGASQWDWEDMEIDFMGEKGMKFWFAIHDKIANNLYLTLKYKIKRYDTQEKEYRAWWNDVPDDGGESYVYIYNKVEKVQTAIRLQLDYKF